MIVIEGPDHAGKTKFAQTLVKKLNMASCGHFYGHLSYWPSPSKSKEFESILAQMVSPRLVLDRFHISEVVYSETYGRTCRITEQGMRKLDACLALNVGRVIVITAAEDVLLQRQAEGKGDKHTETLFDPSSNELLAINNRYWSWACCSKSNVDLHLHIYEDEMHTDYTELHEVQSFIKRYVEAFNYTYEAGVQDDFK